MNRRTRQGLILATTITALVLAAAAQAVQVTFQVRMAQQIHLGNFDPGQDFVDVAGDFNGWGTAPLTPLSDADGDSIYEVTVSGFSPAATISFKFRINGQWDGSEEFPGGGPNRTYTVQPTGNVILVWYGDVVPGGGHAGVGELHWWNDTVFYEIFVRSFNDSDGDGVGDFPGLTARLDYLNDGDPATDTDLGITGIWLMPVNDSPSYHGYDAVDYESINPDYGTMADFETFLAEAHARGIKVIIDYVMNHCSDQHPWFQAAALGDLTYRDYFRWEVSDPGQTGPWGQDVWHWSGNGWYYGLFYGGMPDLNYDTPAVKTAMFNTASYWLDTVGVDGFRLDAVLYIHEDGDVLQNTAQTFQFWQDFNAHVKAVDPDVLSVGEAWTGSSTAVQYVTDDRLDLCFEFDLSGATMWAAGNSDAGGLGGKASQVYELYPYLQFATFLTNHDQDRSFTVLGEDPDRAKVAAGLYLTLPGVPFVYYGEEIGMVGSGDHRFIRSPMQWSPAANAGFTTGTPWQAVNGNFTTYNVASEEPDPGSLLNWYKQLIRVRNGTPALRRGMHLPLASSRSEVLAFVRDDSVQTVLCLANTSPDPVTGLAVSGAEGSLVPGDHTVVNLLDPGNTLPVTVTPAFEILGLDLAGYQVAVYEFVSASPVDPDTGDLPRTGLILEQNHPNPFNPATTIRYTVPVRSHVRIGIYDVAGREVAVLRNEVQDQGEQEVRWNGTDSAGQPAGAGPYFVRLDSGRETRLAKMMLVK